MIIKLIYFYATVHSLGVTLIIGVATSRPDTFV